MSLLRAGPRSRAHQRAAYAAVMLGAIAVFGGATCVDEEGSFDRCGAPPTGDACATRCGGTYDCLLRDGTWAWECVCDETGSSSKASSTSSSSSASTGGGQGCAIPTDCGPYCPHSGTCVNGVLHCDCRECVPNTSSCNECHQCQMEDFCETEYEECLRDSDCAAFSACIMACESTACHADCAAADPQGKAAYAYVDACVCKQCPDHCDEQCGGQP